MREAMLVPPAERGSFLDSSCGGDTALRSEVEAMIARQDSATIPGAAAPRAEHHESAAAEGAPAGPQRTGKYTIVGVLGEGGMGVVYLAEQDRPRRKVALKVIRPGLLTPRMLRRFEHESQILGRLQHPGIAQIHEAGMADHGSGPQPYFAMEHVEGLPLAEYAKAKALPTRARLGLFIKVCEAVHHAHQKGVVHRDLKPGNILVTADGQPKVLDFGVARAVDSDVQSATMQTDMGQLVGTLPYMSPEQVAGDVTELDTRSDVYTLGVILYELLSGKLPHAVSGKTIPEAVRIIGLEEPVPLSVANSTLRGDLQTIVAKALEKDKLRRYQSASELAADVIRYLRDEPISARPPSSWYLFRKFAARNRALVGGVAAAFVLLALGVVGTTWQAVEATRGRKQADVQKGVAMAAEGRAREESDTSKEINDFLISMLNAVNPEEAQGHEPTVREIVDKAAAGIGDRFKDRPRVEMAVRETIGHTYSGLSRFADSQAQYKVVADLATREYGPEDRQTLTARRNLLGTMAELGQYEKAEPELKEVIAILERVYGKDDPDAAMAGMDLGRIYQETGRTKQAEPLLRRAVEIGRKTRGELDVQVITALHNLGTALKDSQDTEGAIEILREALKLRLRVHGPLHPDTLYTKNNLGAALAKSNAPGAHEEAEAMIRETLADRTKVLGADHTATLTTLSNLAVLLTEQKKYLEALPMVERAYEGWRVKLGEEHPKTLVALANLAFVYEDVGRADDAEKMYRKAIEGRKHTSGGKDPDTWSVLNNLAMLLQKQGKLEEAEGNYREVLSMCEPALPKDHLYTAIFRSNFGECLTQEGKLEEAERVLTASREVLQGKLGPGHVRTQKVLERLAALYDKQGRTELAASTREQIARK